MSMVSVIDITSTLEEVVRDLDRAIDYGATTEDLSAIRDRVDGAIWDVEDLDSSCDCDCYENDEEPLLNNEEIGILQNFVDEIRDAMNLDWSTRVEDIPAILRARLEE